jgi:hypothetical protein
LQIGGICSERFLRSDQKIDRVDRCATIRIVGRIPNVVKQYDLSDSNVISFRYSLHQLVRISPGLNRKLFRERHAITQESHDPIMHRQFLSTGFRAYWFTIPGVSPWHGVPRVSEDWIVEVDALNHSLSGSNCTWHGYIVGFFLPE